MQSKGAQADQALALPKDKRPNTTPPEWRASIDGVTDALSAVSVQLGNDVRMQDPAVAEMVQIRRGGLDDPRPVRQPMRRAARQPRRQISRRRWTPPQMAIQRGRLSSGLQADDELINRPGEPGTDRPMP